ncbi:RNA-binding S4 domain-containing protein [Brevibacterium sp. 5221]|uniref:RNA-binding S4 domain-containing protein n=1 Tax=Brevibacterium rongguiense TaxID=2695267 RepID=A0A6N9HAX3_9MICO|nr:MULTISPECIES: RNA-binding S4 domain-containing protein [Brevibacterium]MYM20712.1 RNA-binding S4 domain-containing protein [Brevibacterium rongguiense]
MEEISISGESIRLGQLLKLHGIAETGAMAKDLLAAGEVSVNGEPEQRRGRALVPGDRIEVLGQTIAVAAG